MKKILKLSVVFSLFFMLLACGDLLRPEPKNIDKLLEKADNVMKKTNDFYYEKLRLYKQGEHEVTFGWYGGWTGNKNDPPSRRLYCLPDSTDFVSLWGCWFNLSPEQKEDLKMAQEIKGIRALACILLFDMGNAITPEKPEDKTWKQWAHEFWGWEDGNEEKIKESIERYANAVCDTIFKYNLDGFDLDAEPNLPQPFPTDKELWVGDRMNIFIKTMAKRIGKKAETEEGRKKLLVVDGEPYWFSAEMATYFDYFILQAYNSYSYTDLDNRFNRIYNKFKSTHSLEECAKKIIVTENFEAYSDNGGVPHTTREGESMTSYYGMAKWKVQGKYNKGGIGSYHMEKDYAQKPNYKYLRRGIQIMNPSK